MKKNLVWLFRIIIIIGFLLTLFWVEGSSHRIAQHNGGYGTFDMKAYDAGIVETVLETMDSDGYKISYRYYIWDYFFILFLGLLQYMISRNIYHPLKSKIKVANLLLLLSIAILILRGIADIIENTMLLNTLMMYPTINKKMIEIAKFTTEIKLGCIKLWVLLMIIGLVMRLILNRKGRKQGSDSSCFHLPDDYRH
jgi:hypothetical protein